MSRLTSRRVQNTAVQTQLAQVPSIYLNQNFLAVPNRSPTAKPNTRIFLQQSNQNANVISNQNNLVSKYGIKYSRFCHAWSPSVMIKKAFRYRSTFKGNSQNEKLSREARDKDDMKENKPMTEGSNLLNQQKLSAKQHYLSIARYVVGRSTNISKKYVL